MIPNEIVPCFF